MSSFHVEETGTPKPRPRPSLRGCREPVRSVSSWAHKSLQPDHGTFLRRGSLLPCSAHVNVLLGVHAGLFCLTSLGFAGTFRVVVSPGMSPSSLQHSLDHSASAEMIVLAPEQPPHSRNTHDVHAALRENHWHGPGVTCLCDMLAHGC